MNPQKHAKIVDEILDRLRHESTNIGHPMFSHDFNIIKQVLMVYNITPKESE